MSLYPKNFHIKYTFGVGLKDIVDFFDSMFIAFRDCLEVYHPHCAGRDNSSVKTVDRWTCG